MGAPGIFSTGGKLGVWDETPQLGPGIEPRWGFGGFVVKIFLCINNSSTERFAAATSTSAQTLYISRGMGGGQVPPLAHTSGRPCIGSSSKLVSSSVCISENRISPISASLLSSCRCSLHLSYSVLTSLQYHCPRRMTCVVVSLAFTISAHSEPATCSYKTRTSQYYTVN